MNNFEGTVDQMIANLLKLDIEGNLIGLSKAIVELQALSERTRSNKAFAAINFYKGVLDYRSGNFTGAAEFMKITLDFSRSANIDYFIMKADTVLGAIYVNQGDCYVSLMYYLDAYKIAEKNPQFQYSSIIYNNIGSLFVWIDESAIGKSYFLEAYELYFKEELEDMPFLENLVCNIMEACISMGDFDDYRKWRTLENMDYGKDGDSVLACMDNIVQFLENYQNCEEIEIVTMIEAFLRFIEQSEDYTFVFRYSFLILVRVSKLDTKLPQTSPNIV